MKSKYFAHVCLIGIALSCISAGTVVEDNNIEDKLTEIYETLAETEQYIHVMYDSQSRNLHYVKPHTSFHQLCPECLRFQGKAWDGLKVDDVVIQISVTRLKELREIRRQALSLPIHPPQPVVSRVVESINIEEELDSILALLKIQKNHVYVNLETEGLIYHYSSKHHHKALGCPQCLGLKYKQITETQFISRNEYDELLKIESQYTLSEE